MHFTGYQKTKSKSKNTLNLYFLALASRWSISLLMNLEYTKIVTLHF